MVKSKKTRQKRPDFQKVKLKVGKRLPRSADNVTQTSFKTRSIQMRQRPCAKDEELQPTAKRKVNIQELMSQSRHCNARVRLEAITGLRRTLATDDDLLQQRLADVLGIACELFVDRDAAIRDAVIRTLRSILPRVSSNQISTFFPLITAHLSCAMTHIGDDVRAASLPLLDVCLDHYPTLVASIGNARLLRDFVGLVSHRKRCASAASSTNTQQRSLTVNPASRLSEQKWRTKVLSRLHRYLKAVVDSRLTSTTKNTSLAPASTTIVVCDRFSGYLPLGCAAVNGKAGYLLRSGQPQSGSDDADDVFSTSSSVQTFFEMLVPLLIECWVEVGPSQTTTDVPGNVLAADALAILDSVLGILLLLLRLATEYCDSTSGASMSWVQQKYKKDFIQYFMTNFPYCTHTETTKSKAKSPVTSPQPSIVSLNLAVCEVMTHMLAGEVEASSLPDWFIPVTQYVHNQLAGGRPSHADLTRLLQMTYMHMSLPLQPARKKKLLSAMARLQHNRRPQSSSFLLLLRTFGDIIFNRRHADLARTPVAERWLASLLPTLLQTPPENETALGLLLQSISLARSQGHTAFLETLGQRLSDFLDESFLPRLSPDLQRKAVEILYHVPSMQRAHFVRIVSLSRSLNDSSMQCVLQILNLRFLTSCRKDNRRKDAPFETSDYISFLISLALGTSQEELSTNSGAILNETLWHRHVTTVGYVVKILAQFPDITQIWSLVGTILQKLMEREKSLPSTAAFSILSLSEHTQLTDACWDGLVSLIIQQLLTESASHVSQAIFTVCVSLLAHADGLLRAVIDKLMSLLQESPSLSQAETTVMLLTKLLNTTELREVNTRCQHSLVVVREFVLAHFGDQLNQQWWADFKYALSLASLPLAPLGGVSIT